MPCAKVRGRPMGRDEAMTILGYELPEGATGAEPEEASGAESFICGEGVVPCTCCAMLSEYLCDWPMGDGKTCDAPLCDVHAMAPQVDVSTLKPSEILARKCPGLAGAAVAAIATLSDLHYCPAHWQQAQARGGGR